MKKHILFFSIIAALFIAPAIKAQTYVSGGIYSNTTWTLANSPYIVTDTVVVFPGVTLTIEPGVVVKFDDDIRLEIRQATLFAQGTVTDSIFFTSNATTPSPGIWPNILLNDVDYSVFNYCNIEYCYDGISGYIDTVIITNSSFRHNVYGAHLSHSKLIIDSSTFISNTNGLYLSGSNGFIDNCYFYNNINGCYAFNYSHINNCKFFNNVNGLIGGYWINNSEIKNNNTGIKWRGLIDNCNISNNQIGAISLIYSISIKNSIVDSNYNYGIKMYNCDSVFNCEIKNNGKGLVTYDPPGGDGNKIIMNVVENNNIGIQIGHKLDQVYCNKICNNILYDLYDSLFYGNNISILNNYWCTTDSSIIASHIYDGYDNVNLSLVNYMPIDTSQCYLTGCALTVTATVTNATCDTCHNGSATGHVVNGFPPYTWTWYSSPMQTTQTATGLAPGTYQLCVTDGHGCTACNPNIFIDSTNCTGYSINAYANNATCSSCNDGSAWVNVTGGTPPYAYTWYTIPMQNTDTATGLAHGTYYVCVTDLYGCTVCDSAIVSTGNCSGYFYLYPDTTTLHNYYAVNMASGVLPISYFWDWGDGTNDTIAYPSHIYSTAGFYTICLTITDSAGCTNMYCDSFYLQKNTNAIITVNVIPNTVTGTSENIFDGSLTIFPNPANDYFSLILAENNINAECRIFNVLGEEKYFSEIKNQKTIIDISAFAKGMYFVKVKTDKGIAVKKFIKE